MLFNFFNNSYYYITYKTFKTIRIKLEHLNPLQIYYYKNNFILIRK